MIAIREINGERIGYVLADPPEDGPADVREGIARRNIVATGGVCPCGARMVLPNRAERRRHARLGRTIDVNVEHEAGCPAITDLLLAALARWKR